MQRLSVNDVPPNQRMQQTVWPVTARAKDARSAPAQPAADAQRWADEVLLGPD
jgi:hypothetical protein